MSFQRRHGLDGMESVFRMGQGDRRRERGADAAFSENCGGHEVRGTSRGWKRKCIAYGCGRNGRAEIHAARSRGSHGGCDTDDAELFRGRHFGGAVLRYADRAAFNASRLGQQFLGKWGERRRSQLDRALQPQWLSAGSAGRGGGNHRGGKPLRHGRSVCLKHARSRIDCSERNTGRSDPAELFNRGPLRGLRNARVTSVCRRANRSDRSTASRPGFGDVQPCECAGVLSPGRNEQLSRDRR